MPRLTIIYNDCITLYDGEACEFNWSENETGIAVSAKTSTQQPKANGLLDLIAGASRQRTEARRRELSAEESE